MVKSILICAECFEDVQHVQFGDDGVNYCESCHQIEPCTIEESIEPDYPILIMGSDGSEGIYEASYSCQRYVLLHLDSNVPAESGKVKYLDDKNKPKERFYRLERHRDRYLLRFVAIVQEFDTGIYNLDS